MKVEESALDDEGLDDDDISDPDEDTLAGQMAAMRGVSVKKLVPRRVMMKVTQMMIKRVVLTVKATLIDYLCYLSTAFFSVPL